jgi:hypothetical protein
MVNNNFPGVPFADMENGRLYTAYYAPVVTDSSMIVPALKSLTNNILSGAMAAPNGVDYIAASIDLYLVDPAALAKTFTYPIPTTHPGRWLATYTDNGPGDLDPVANQFAFDVSSFGLTDTTYVTVAVSYSKDAGSYGVNRSVTSPPGNPISRRPTLTIQAGAMNTTMILSWLAYQGAYVVQSSQYLPYTDIQTFTNATYHTGRNIAEIAVDPFTPTQFYRLISQ